MGDLMDGELPPRGHNLPDDLTFDEWLAEGEELGNAERATPWAIGDWWNRGNGWDRRRTEIIRQPNWKGPAQASCQKYGSIASTFKPWMRIQGLSLYHHQIAARLAKLDSAEANRLLNKCEQSKQSIQEFRTEVRQAVWSLISAIWTQDQLDRKARAEAGECVIASLRDNGNDQRMDEALLRWAEVEGRLLRIDRQGPFGNPFIMPDDGERDDVIEKFAKFYWPHKPELLRQIPEHAGKVLACWCYPERCHGHVIAETINRVAAGEGTAEEIAEEIANYDG
jgi:Domain of unknown function (DUF4326)